MTNTLEKGYNGNFNLKKVDTPIEWTPEMLQEYAACAQDPIYFTEKYIKIVHVDHGLVPFLMYDYQKTMMDSMANKRDTIITTARQTGKSTTTCAFILWYILFHKEKTVALLANKGETAREILGKVQLAYMHLPKWIQQGIIKWNEGSMELENNSRVIAAATSSDAIRGYSINLLFIDEAAHIENWDEFFTSTAPTISSGKTTKTILVSTPFGLNHFHKLWSDAKASKNDYNPVEVMWFQVPGRDEEWKKKTISQMGGDFEKFEQEHCCSFIGSSGTLISGWKLKELVNDIQNPSVFNKNGLSQYEQPIKKHQYVAVLDVSRGKGLDYSAMQIVDVTELPYRQVCVYRDNMVTPQDFASSVHRLLKSYNSALCLVEINDIGAQVADILFDDFEYENLLFTENAGTKGKRITAGFGRSVDRGIRTTKIVKNVGCSIIKLLVEQDQLKLCDKNTINEFNTFSKKLNSYEAEPGCHDDLVMCMVLFAWLTAQQYFKELTDINTIAHLRDRTEKELEDDLLPFMISSGVEDVPEEIHGQTSARVIDTVSNF